MAVERLELSQLSGEEREALLACLATVAGVARDMEYIAGSIMPPIFGPRLEDENRVYPLQAPVSRQLVKEHAVAWESRLMAVIEVLRRSRP